jgi:hypothetical protein
MIVKPFSHYLDDRIPCSDENDVQVDTIDISTMQQKKFFSHLLRTISTPVTRSRLQHQRRLSGVWPIVYSLWED